jgi:hypothetical protein
MTRAVRCKPVREHPGRYWCDYRERVAMSDSVTWVAKRTQITGSGGSWRWVSGDTPKGCQINIRTEQPGG